jgi:hypothetical protein
MNDFKSPFQDLKVEMKCMATNGYGKKDEIIFKFPHVVKNATRHCYACNADYEDEEHLLPSLKSYWLGCPKCRNRVKEMERRFYVREFLLEKQAEANKMRHETEEQQEKNVYKIRKR